MSSLNDDEKALLLSCINAYLEKIDFILKNCRYYFNNNFLGKSIINDFESDKKKLIELREKIFLIDISSIE